VRALERGEYLLAVQESVAPGLRGAGGVASEAAFRPQLPEVHALGRGNLPLRRPIRWLLALYDGRVVPFEVDGLKPGGKTYGHRS